MVHKNISLKNPPRGLKTFELPCNEELVRLRKGSLVQLIFGGNYNERMWVKITKKNAVTIKGGQTFEGKLMNTPFTTGKLHWGSKVKFNANHVIDIDKRKRK